MLAETTFTPLQLACQEVFLTLAQLIRHHCPECGGDLSWLVVSVDGSRVLSCGETKTDPDRSSAYTSLQNYWIANQATLFNGGMLSAAAVEAGLEILAVAISEEAGKEQQETLRQWCSELVDESILSADAVRIVFVPEEVFRAAEPDGREEETGDWSATAIQEFCDRWKQGNDLGLSWYEQIGDFGIDSFLPYFAWLRRHDPAARMWLYIRSPQASLIGGSGDPKGVVILCFRKLPEISTLDLVYWTVYNLFLGATVDATYGEEPERKAYLAAMASTIHAKVMLLRQFERDTADHQLRRPRNGSSYNTFGPDAPAALASLHPFLAKIPGFRWVSLFGWDQAYGRLYRIGWELHKQTRDLGRREFWQEWEAGRERFEAAAEALGELSQGQTIVLIGNLLFESSLRKGPVIVVCRRTDHPEHGANPSESSHRDLQRKHGYVFLVFDQIMRILLPIVEDAAKELARPAPGTAPDLTTLIVKSVGRCYKKLQDVDSMPASVNALGEGMVHEFEQTLRSSLDADEKANFGSRFVKHLIWVLLHEIDPATGFQCLAYFPSRIKPNAPSGGCLVALNDVPSPEHLLLIENYVTDYFMAKSLVSADFEIDFPCTYTNAGFERAVLSRMGKAVTSKGEGRCVLALAFIDMDGLKKINDETKHHILGTVAIRAFVECLGGFLFTSQNEPSQDLILGRWGGDEFLVATVVKCTGEHAGFALQQMTEQRLKQICLKFKVFLKLNWENAVKTAYASFSSRKRIPNPALASIEKLLKAVPQGLGFTAGIASETLGPVSIPQLAIYEQVRSMADRICYIGKQRARGSILALRDDIDAEDTDGNSRPICLKEAAFSKADEDLRRMALNHDNDIYWVVKTVVDPGNVQDLLAEDVIAFACEEFSRASAPVVFSKRAGSGVELIAALTEIRYSDQKSLEFAIRAIWSFQFKERFAINSAGVAIKCELCQSKKYLGHRNPSTAWQPINVDD